jgi:hypothetical protein
MTSNNISVNVHTLTNEQRQQLFIKLFEADPSLPNVLNPEQRRRLFSILVAIDSSLAASLPDARSAIQGITNEQVNRFTMFVF